MPPDLEERLRALEIKSAADVERDKHIDAAVVSLTATAERLEAAFHQGKGAVWLAGGILFLSNAITLVLSRLGAH